MSFGSNTIIEVRTTGSDTNGGAFDPGATFATNLAATVANTSAPIVTSASYNFVAGDVGAYVFIKTGTNWIPGWYQIASVSSNAATLTAGIGTSVLFNTSIPTVLNTVAGCASTASPTSGTWSIDYSQQDSPQFTFTDMVIDGTTNTKFTSAGNPVGPNFVGNTINVSSGTGFTVQRVQVASVSGTTATCDKSLGTLSSTGGNGKLGGALASPGMAGAINNGISGSGGPTTFLKSGTYSLTASSNVSGGVFSSSLANSSNSQFPTIVGYSTNRIQFNTDTRPIVQPSANSITCITIANGGGIYNIEFANGNSSTSCTGGQVSFGIGVIWNCKASNLANGFIAGQNGNGGPVKIWFCEAVGCTAIGIMGWARIGNACYYCNVHDWSTSTAIGISQFQHIEHCLIYNGVNQGIFVNGICSILNCTIDTIGTSGSQAGIFLNNNSGAGLIVIMNNVISNCGTLGVNDVNNPSPFTQIINSAFYNNGTNYTSTLISNYNLFNNVILTASPYTSPNFVPNSTSGGGLSLKAASYPTLLNSTTTNYADIGAVQHQDSGGSGPTYFSY